MREPPTKKGWLEHALEYALIIAVVVLGAQVGLIVIRSTRQVHPAWPAGWLHQVPPPKDHEEIMRKECQHLTDGKLIFQPTQTMRQGVSYLVEARVGRGASADLTKDLEGSNFKIENTKASCKVAMLLTSQEESAFNIRKSPPDRQEDQYILADSYAQWQWNVLPKKSGTLHLRIYVAPVLYVNGIFDGMERYVPLAPRVITVTPDYVFAIRSNLEDHWSIYSVVMNAVAIPLVLWGIKKLRDQRQPRRIHGFNPK